MPLSTLLRRTLLAVLLLALCSPPARADDLPRAVPADVSLKPEGLGRIDTLMADAVAKKQIAGGVVLLARHGKVGYLKAFGMRDAEAGKPMTPDTLFRIASMTKPVTSVAVMMLVEEGKIRLDDPLSKYVPEFKSPRVLVEEKGKEPRTVPAEREPTIHDLLTHTSGLTYGFIAPGRLAELYRRAGVSAGLTQTECSTADNIRRLAEVPLAHQPGAAWTYGMSTDVLGRVVEVASGQPFGVFCRDRIFRPLDMRNTAFFLAPEQKDRLAVLYRAGRDKKAERVGEDPVREGALTYSASYPYRGPRTYFSGGGGLVSTATDYARFLQMLLNGGKLGGVRLLKPETVRRMTTNQIGSLKLWIPEHGDAFGYGFGVVTAAARGRAVASPGSYSWGGAFHTYFWVDPERELVCVLMTQVIPFNHLSLRSDLQKLTYQALAD
jgi:CubicO group peptidase (beta-lactamase class C family)